jgi:mono/diheme cytochrome c family protein
VLLRSCATCHRYGHPKFSIYNDGDMTLRMDEVQARAEELATSLYDSEEPMPPPKFAQGQQLLTDEERANLHAYLLHLKDAAPVSP